MFFSAHHTQPSIIAGSTLIATIEKLAFNGFTTSTDPQHSGNIGKTPPPLIVRISDDKTVALIDLLVLNPYTL